MSASIDPEEVKREERRGIFFLGLLVVIATMRLGARDSDLIQYGGDSWALIPILNLLILAWFGYAACMLVFFSDDVLKGRPGNLIRRLTRIAGFTLAVSVGGLLVWMVASIGSVLAVPNAFALTLIALPLLVTLIYVFAIAFRGLWKIIGK